MKNKLELLEVFIEKVSLKTFLELIERSDIPDAFWELIPQSRCSCNKGS